MTSWRTDWSEPVREEEPTSNDLRRENHLLRQKLCEIATECEEQARLNGMGSEREARLTAQLDEAYRREVKVTRESLDLRDSYKGLQHAHEELRKRGYGTPEEVYASAMKLAEENCRLKDKCDRQRVELRRLNLRLEAMWEGVRFAHKCEKEQTHATKQRASELELHISSLKTAKKVLMDKDYFASANLIEMLIAEAERQR